MVALSATTGGLVAEAEVNCIGISPAVIEKAVERARRKAVDQMLGNGPPAGHIVDIDADGSVIRVGMMVTEPAAIAKVQHRVYCGVVAELDEAGGRLFRVSLVDNDNLAKAGDASVICKVFDRSAEVDKKLRKKASRLSKRTGAPFNACSARMSSPTRIAASAVGSTPI